MKPASLLHEALRNISSGTSRTLLHMCFVVIVAGALLAADAFATRSLILSAEQFRDGGGATLIVTAPDSVAGPACDSLVSLPGIEAAGAVSESKTAILLTALPDAPVSHFLATPGFVKVLAGAGPAIDGLAISRDLADTLRMTVGDVISTSEGPSVVGAIFDYPSDGRRAGLGWAIVEVVESDVYGECWARSWPPQPRLRSLLLTTLTADGSANTDNPPVISQLNAAHGQDFDGTTLWESRISQFAPLAGMLLVGVFASLMLWLRRLELASNLHAGMSRPAMFGVLLMEAAAWLVPTAVMILSLAVVLSTGVDGVDRPAIVWQGAAQAAGTVVGGVAGTLMASAMVRERHLFAYFKNRN